jgi:hypothetical protein
MKSYCILNAKIKKILNNLAYFLQIGQTSSQSEEKCVKYMEGITSSNVSAGFEVRT